jgi:hypothetical protein
MAVARRLENRLRCAKPSAHIPGACVILLLLAFAAPAALPPGTRYVISHFDTDHGSGDERLYISVSPDALT